MQAEKPIALNGITDIVNRADLADRCIFVTAERILDKDRKPKEEVMAAFEAERPRILGALLDAVAHGIKTLPTVTGNDWPRMADFAKWATACEGAFAKPGHSKPPTNAIAPKPLNRCSTTTWSPQPCKSSGSLGRAGPANCWTR